MADAPRRFARSRSFAAWVLAGTAIVWIMCAIALWIYAGPSRRVETRSLVIPRGTAAAVRAGRNALELPAEWGFRSGDTLRLINHDVALHSVGPWSVVPGQVRNVVMRSTALSGVFGCSIHTSGRFVIDVEPRRTDWLLTLFPTIAFGPTLGAAAYAVSRVAKKLNDEPTVPPLLV